MQSSSDHTNIPDDDSPALSIQMPSDNDLRNISQMWTGGVEDKTQLTRLLNISKSIPNNMPVIVIRTDSNLSKLSAEWEDFFKLFNPTDTMSTRHARNKMKEIIKKAFHQISDDDPIKKTLLAVHTKEYVNSIIDACVEAQAGEIPSGSHSSEDRYYELDKDVVVQPHTFEILIRDFVTTMSTVKNSDNLSPIFSLGLPTHHAYHDKASGFCIFNKVAMLIEFFQQENVVICGLDINADNGLQDCLFTRAKHSDAGKQPQNIVHYDIYDSQVWPYEEFKDDNITKKNQRYEYHSINLKEDDYNRQKKEIHPALQHIIMGILAQAKKHGNNLAIYIALGWDSHVDENASCGKVSFEDAKEEERYRQTKRFSAADFDWFYQQLFEIQNTYKISFLYIGLEGGYTRKVYQSQCVSLIETASASAQQKVKSSYKKASKRKQSAVEHQKQAEEPSEETTEQGSQKNSMQEEGEKKLSKRKKTEKQTDKPPKQTSITSFPISKKKKPVKRGKKTSYPPNFLVEASKSSGKEKPKKKSLSKSKPKNSNYKRQKTI